MSQHRDRIGSPSVKRGPSPTVEDLTPEERQARRKAYGIHQGLRYRRKPEKRVRTFLELVDAAIERAKG